MAENDLLNELRKEHRLLSEKVETEQSRPGSDSLAIRELKKRKLFLKERIERLSREVA